MKLPAPADHADVGRFFNGNTKLNHMAGGPGGGNGPRPLNGLQLALGRMFYRMEKSGENAWFASNRIANKAGEIGEWAGYIAVTLAAWIGGDNFGKMLFPAHPIVGGLVFGLAAWGLAFKADRWLENNTNLGGRSRLRMLSASFGNVAFEFSAKAGIATYSHPAMAIGKAGQKLIGYNPWRDPKRPRI